ncbi:uncharacterized protein DUF1045 [Sphaerotilus hippei]|uniref:Uncharacterized protein DUF1045 n=1 Tax=Sphaerotilus hippei TaxID=744406 RepID=A0A318H3U5_9BURK|nr:DUF1045 domain-containing protein [Sphaerotilus hippei]PXW95800.1 uncharacterized protein DUF1045 [Sphaerotilus hippei]
MTQRYAVYHVPPILHPLWAAGCSWLGRDPCADEIGRPPPGRIQPWRYGFHATLKPPMRLAAGIVVPALQQAVRALARAHQPFEMPALQVSELDQFIALRLVTPLGVNDPLQDIGDACVCDLDELRAPLSASETARRLSTPLDDDQQALLARWGYPHVLHRWRYHFTLSDRLADEGQRAELLAQAREHFAAALSVPLTFDALSVFVELAPGAPLRLSQRFPLGKA